MKKLIALAICLGFILSVSAAYAAPVGNIATPSLLKQGIIAKDDNVQYGIIGYSEGDLSWNRNLKNQDEDTEYFFYGGKIGLLIMDRFIPYTILGMAEAKQQRFKVDANEVEWQTDLDFVWGVGGTAMLYETEPGQVGEGVLHIGVDGRYRQSHLSVDAVALNGVTHESGSSRLTSSRFELGDWQVALAVAYQYKQIVPYVGVKYSDATGDAEAIIDGVTYKNDFQGEDNVGIFVGGDIIVNDSLTMNVEGRFMDETALTLGGALRF